MKKVTTTLSYHISSGKYCNIKTENHHGFPADQRCRFCTNLGKGKFICVIHNKPLVIEDGCLIQKCASCLKNMKTKGMKVQNEMHVRSPKEIIQWTIKTYSKEYERLISEGYPAALAAQIAKEVVV